MASNTRRQSNTLTSKASRGQSRATVSQPASQNLGDMLASMFGSNPARTTVSVERRSMNAGAPFMPATVADITALRNAALIAVR